MFPFKYRLNKVVAIRFRNVSFINRHFNFEVEYYKDEQIVNFNSAESDLCIVSNYQFK